MNATATPPSIPFPENAERRAAITSGIQAATGLDEAVLELLIRTFYAAARKDEVIGHLFDGVQNWEKHIAKITTFWSSVGLLTGRYQGQPLAAHFPLPLEPLHFARWLVLFEQTAREVCTPEGTVDVSLRKVPVFQRVRQLGRVAEPVNAHPAPIGRDFVGYRRRRVENQKFLDEPAMINAKPTVALVAALIAVMNVGEQPALRTP